MIDWDRLEALRSDIGEEDFGLVAHLFVSEMEETLTRLASASGLPTAADFHFLRGSAANLGFVTLVDACAAAEIACKRGERPNLAQVQRAFAESIAEAVPRVPELAQAA